MAFSLDLEGSGRFGDSSDRLYKENDKESEVMNFTWEKTEIILTNVDPNSTMTPDEAFEYYTNPYGQRLVKHRFVKSRPK